MRFSEMTPVACTLILTGVRLNALAQFALKALGIAIITVGVFVLARA